MIPVAAVIAAICVGPAVGTSFTAHLALVGTKPVAVRGTHFIATERVTVTAKVGGKTARELMVASQAGAFVARFTELHPSLCSSYFIHAAGNKGSWANYRFTPSCAPGPSP
jgi:hypothetical protein